MSTNKPATIRAGHVNARLLWYTVTCTIQDSAAKASSTLHCKGIKYCPFQRLTVLSFAKASSTVHFKGFKYCPFQRLQVLSITFGSGSVCSIARTIRVLLISVLNILCPFIWNSTGCDKAEGTKCCCWYRCCCCCCCCLRTGICTRPSDWWLPRYQYRPEMNCKILVVPSCVHGQGVSGSGQRARRTCWEFQSGFPNICKLDVSISACFQGW